MDLVNIMYKYINKKINSDELQDELNKINLDNYKEDEKEEIKKIIEAVNLIIRKVPNEIDEFEKMRIKRIDDLINKFSSMTNEKGEPVDFIKHNKEKLIKDRNKVNDGGERFKQLFNLLCNNSLINKYLKSMDDYELLKFIAQYISVPLPPEIGEDGFNDLVKVGIEHNEKEYLWRLAFNYGHHKYDFSKIEDYYIQERDAYYLSELVCAIEKSLDIDGIINKVNDTKDNDFIKSFYDHCEKISILKDKINLLNI